MLSALWLISGFMLGQAPMPTAPSRSVSFLPPVALDESQLKAHQAASTTTKTPVTPSLDSSDKEKSDAAAQSPTEIAAVAAPPFSIFSRPAFADRHSLSFVQSTGSGRFNLIDWESRPNGDRLWWLGRWPVPEDVQLNTGIGLGIHWWAGPVHEGTAQPPSLPAHVFDLYLDWSWLQRWSYSLTSEVRFRPGLYTDFRTTPPDAFRVPGEAVGVYQAGPDLFFVGGVEYLQRNDIHLLPVGGILWQPTPSWELSLIFPEPKIAVELSTSQHLWGYVAAEYGGGRWTYKNDSGHNERIESSDYRLAFGIEWREDYFRNLKLLSQKSAAFLEVGYVFERHVRLAGPATEFEPKPAWMIRFGSVW